MKKKLRKAVFQRALLHLNIKRAPDGEENSKDMFLGADIKAERENRG